MLAIQSGIAKYYCLCTEGAVAFQTPGVFDSPSILDLKHAYKPLLNYLVWSLFHFSFWDLTLEHEVQYELLLHHIKFPQQTDSTSVNRICWKL